MKYEKQSGVEGQKNMLTHLIIFGLNYMRNPSTPDEIVWQQQTNIKQS